MTSEFAIQVVKPVVVRISLADTIAVKAPRSGIPINHRGESGGDLIVNRDCERKLCSRISFLYGAPDAQQDAVRLDIRKNIKGFVYGEGDQVNLEAKCWYHLCRVWTRSR